MFGHKECLNRDGWLTNRQIIPADRAADLADALTGRVAGAGPQYIRGSGAVGASTLRPFDAITSRYHFPESLIVRACVS